MASVTAAYIDETVWVVEITLKEKAGGGSATYYLGFDYYDTGELYTSSPIIYPLLAGTIDSIDIARSVGREVAILHEPRVSIYGKTYLDDYGKSFLDLASLYSFHEAQVEFRCYWKKTGALTSHADGTNIKLGRLVVKNHQWVDDVLELSCRQVFVKDKEISKKFSDTIFASMPEDNNYGEYGAVVFGENVVIEAPFLSSAAMGASGAASTIFTGWCATSHPMSAFNTLYARNKENPRDLDWVPINIYASGGGLIVGNQYELGLGDADGAVGESRAIVFSPGPNTGEILYAINFGVTRNAAVSNTDGHMIIKISRAPSYSVAGTYVDEQTLRTINFDIPNTGTLFTAVAYVYPPLVCTENENYLIEYFWSNPTAANYYRLRFKTAGTNANDNGQKRDNATRGAGWQTTANDHYLAAYGLTRTSGGWDDSAGSAPNLYSFHDFKCVPWGTLLPSYDSDNSDGKIHYQIELKASVNGLEDDGSGTYTGSANSVIKNPSDIIRFLLLDDELGPDHGSGNIDSTAFNTARTKASSAALNLAFAIESETFTFDMIQKIVAQTRLIAYLNARGRPALKYPVNPQAAKTIYAHAGMRDRAKIVGTQEAGSDSILNDFLVPYGVDKLNTPKALTVIRKVGGESFKGVEYLNGTESSISDSVRVARAAASISFYGRKNYRTPADLYASTSTGPKTLMKYLFDRWHKKTTSVTLRLPAVTHNTAELFEDVYISSERLGHTNGTLPDVLWHSAGAEVFWYSAGVPITTGAFGSYETQVTGLRYIGDEVELLTETVNPFEEV